MPLEHHPLHREFPEQREALDRLLSEDGRYAQIAEQYEELDRRIYEIENGNASMDDLELHKLKLQRVAMKDEFAQALSQSGKS